MFFYASKGKPQLSRQGHINVFNYPPVPHTKKIHPTERPVELISEIITTFTKPGSQLMVPFLGSGKTIIAAHENQMEAFGFELTQSYKDSYIIQVNERY